MTKANPFDFSNVSDLPEALQKKLITTSKVVVSNEWAALVVSAMEFGLRSVNITQVIAAATRMGMTVPSDQTVRGYLNRAVEDGVLTKPTRQTYAAPLAGSAKVRSKAEEAGLGEADPVVVGDVPVEEIDPLSAL